MRSYVSAGENLRVRAASAVKSGDFLVMGEAFGFAVADAAEGELFALVRRGEFRYDFPVQVGAFAAVFVTPAGELTTFSAGNRRVGMTGASGDTVILQEIFGGAPSGEDTDGGGGDVGGDQDLFLSFTFDRDPATAGESVMITGVLIDNNTGMTVPFNDFDSITAVMNGLDDSGMLTGSGESRFYTPQEAGSLQIDGWVTVNSQIVYAMSAYLTVE